MTRSNVKVTHEPFKANFSLLPLAGREMSTGQRALAVLYRWEGNRRSNVEPAVCHRLCGISTYRRVCYLQYSSLSCWLRTKTVQLYNKTQLLFPKFILGIFENQRCRNLTIKSS